MNQICRDIFRAIHEGKWLKIEYRNKADQITKYWIGIRDLDPAKRTLKVDGLHLGMYTLGEYDKIFVDSILSTEVIEGTYCPENRQLIEDIEMHPERYKTIFSSSANLKILNYLELCNRMDTTPYITDYDLIHYIDGDRVKNGRKQQQQRMMRLEGKNAAEGGETGSLDIHGDLTEHRPAAGQSDMRVFYGFDALPHFVRPTVTVGSYDGVHSGHLALLRTVAGRARAQGGESVVLTFEPHPRVTLGRADGLRLLTSLEEKIYLLGQQGIDNLIVIPFDKAFSALAPDTFIRDYLVGRIGAETLVVGFNHRFGRDKQGSYDYLGSHGFGLEVVEVGECDVDAEKVSSTVIRRLVAQGDMARAARLLSHPYLIIGTAAAGRIGTDDPLKLLPPAGSYQVRIGGRPARLTVDTSQNLIIRDGCPDGRAVLTF